VRAAFFAMPAFPPLLIAEDDAQDMFLFTRLLQATGALHALHIALDGRDAIRLLTPVVGQSRLVAKPAVAFLDVALPEIGGLEVLTWIRQHRELDDLPVVMMATTPDSASIARAARLGAQCFVAKFPGKASMARLLQNAPQFTGRDGVHIFDLPENLLRSHAAKTYYPPR